MGASIVQYAGKGQATCVTLNGLELYFSYGTCIGVRVHGSLIVAVNQWGTMTGRHIDCIPGVAGAVRVAHEDLLVTIDQLKVA